MALSDRDEEDAWVLRDPLEWAGSMEGASPVEEV